MLIISKGSVQSSFVRDKMVKLKFTRTWNFEGEDEKRKKLGSCSGQVPRRVARRSKSQTHGNSVVHTCSS